MIFLAVALSYLLGAIPTGLWLGLSLRGVDIRQSGSKNIGATNTMRVLGKTLGGIALI
ncbi:MAG: glycerol-3-phosphate acyltransferase, partial [FCB group bacterium]|nr:glycerol-3-phosphate acyltransferase [FCB group bacterium]